jgi:hypothetical protein
MNEDVDGAGAAFLGDQPVGSWVQGGIVIGAAHDVLAEPALVEHHGRGEVAAGVRVRPVPVIVSLLDELRAIRVVRDSEQERARSERERARMDDDRGSRCGREIDAKTAVLARDGGANRDGLAFARGSVGYGDGQVACWIDRG